MPSVITMTSGIFASTASITASLVPAGGTNTTETSAPVAAMASATVPNTGTSVPAELDRLAGLARVGPADDLGARRGASGPRACAPRSR